MTAHLLRNRLTRVTGSSFGGPLAVPNMAWGFEADTMPILLDLTPVGQWNDLSGNNRHAVQSLPTRQPLYRTAVVNGKPAFQFDGGDDFMQAVGWTLTQPFTILALVGSLADGAAQRIVSMGANQAIIVEKQASNLSRIFAGLNQNGNSIAGTGTFLLSGVFNSPASFVKVNGAGPAPGDAGTNTMEGVTLGAYSNGTVVMNGFLVAAYCWSRALTTVEHNNLGSHFAAKYNFSWTTM